MTEPDLVQLEAENQRLRQALDDLTVWMLDEEENPLAGTIREWARKVLADPEETR